MTVRSAFMVLSFINRLWPGGMTPFCFRQTWKK
jgi:hypothetical protein